MVSSREISSPNVTLRPQQENVSGKYARYALMETATLDMVVVNLEMVDTKSQITVSINDQYSLGVSWRTGCVEARAYFAITIACILPCACTKG